MVYFFTLPPVPWPYVLINLNNPNIRYVLKYHKYIRAIIIDSGVEIFRNPDRFDYDGGFVEQLRRGLTLRDRIRRILRGVPIFLTIPDYCDDYRPYGLWLDDYDNIFRTLDSIMYALDKEPYRYYLIPIQGYNELPDSIEKSLEYLEAYGVLKTHKYYAVANLCVSRRVKTIVETLRIARAWLKNKHIHAFGISLRALRRAKNLINSFDSMAWTRPVNIRLLKANWSAKNKAERIKFFYAWVNRLYEILGEKYEATKTYRL